MAVLAIVGLVSNLSLDAYQQADRSRDHTLEVLGAVDRILQIAVDVETAVRGFVVTGNEAFLEPRRAALQSAPEAMARLQRLTVGNAGQHQRANRLGPLIEQKLAWTSRVAEARRKAGFESAKRLSATTHGKQLMDEIRRLCGEMRAQEMALLAERDAATHRHGRAAELVTILGSVLGLLLVAGATIINRLENAQRKAAEAALQRAHDELEVRVQERTIQLTRANRSLRMLRECNQVLVRVTEETALLDQICRVIVGVGGYQLGWVGCALQEEGQNVRAQAGLDNGFLSLVHPTWTDTERGHCPCGRALRSAKPVVVRDVRTDPDFATWRDEALARGYCSVAALPLRTEDAAFGVLTVYAGEGQAFDEEEMKLLEELAGDVAHGLRTLRLRSERDKMRAQLVQADRLVSIGTLAAGVAHEINNPLAYVMANLEYLGPEFRKLATELPAGRLNELEKVLAEVREGTERIKNTVRDLKTVSRTDKKQCGPVDVRHVLDSSANMAHNEIKHRARLVKHYGATPLVEANDGRLGQVFLNLIMNAAHAIDEGATHRNEIRLVTGTGSAGNVVVEVRDTGAGIPPENLGQIFDPFFTTKPIGEGTGLGLFICRNIVSGLGGELTVESQVGRGSVFRVVLPPAQSRAVAERPRLDYLAGGRRGWVLVIDDELAIGEAIRRLLTPEHDVIVLTSARQAHQRIVLGERFDVIICDLMMPEMTGMDLHTELARLAPDQAARMVLLTGGAFTSRGREFLQRVPNQRLEKPFDAQDIHTVVRGFVS